MVNKDETALERQLRLEKAKQRRELKKLQESPASRASRLEKRRQKRRNESPTSRESRLKRGRLEKVLQRARERRRNESPSSRASRLEKRRLIDERRRVKSSTSSASRLKTERLHHKARLLQKRQADEPRGNAEVSKINIDQDVEMNSIQKEEDNIVNVILDDIDGDKNCNDVRRDNIEEMSNDFCNNGASVELNSAIENLSDSNLGIPNKNVLNLDLHPSEPLGKYQCFRCPLNFTEKNYLSKHLIKHFDRHHPYMCQVCEKTFSARNLLKIHINTWADFRPFQCEQCNEAFTTAWNLCEHIKIAHSAISPFKCAECDYMTFRKHNLKRHTSSHMDDRPFKCNNCSYASKSQQNLKAHERTHKDDKSYKCDICYSRFVHSRSLGTHRKKHLRIGLTIHRCRFCPSVLDCLDALRKHIEVVHRDEVLK